MSSTGTLPWLLVGTGALGLTALLVFRKKVPIYPPGSLTPEVKSKATAKIATSNDPNLLAQLATGLQKAGAPEEAVQAIQKVANITGQPQTIPGTTITVAPTAPMISAPIVSLYKVANGDIPGAIASRFGVKLSTLANANGPNSKRIMAGAIKVNEILKLPLGVVDKGPQNRAKGVAS